MKKLLELLFLKNIKSISNVTINSKYYDKLKEIDGIDACMQLVSSLNPKITTDAMMIAADDARHQFDMYSHNTLFKVLTVYDEDYPVSLNALENKRPVILFAKGNTDILSKPNFAIVGTRKPSAWSKKIEQSLVQKVIEISRRVIVSGFALGCDGLAHETTVKMGKETIAVLPSGFNEISPVSHKKMISEILNNNGCIITEYEPDAQVTKYSYVERDAIIAALSDVTFVIECGVNSGTMHTVEAAVKMHKPVACYYTDVLGKGNYEGNQYILEQKGADRVSNLVDLEKLLDKISKIQVKESTKGITETVVQNSLFD